MRIALATGLVLTALATTGAQMPLSPETLPLSSVEDGSTLIAGDLPPGTTCTFSVTVKTVTVKEAQSSPKDSGNEEMEIVLDSQLVYAGKTSRVHYPMRGFLPLKTGFHTDINKVFTIASNSVPYGNEVKFNLKTSVTDLDKTEGNKDDKASVSQDVSFACKTRGTNQVVVTLPLPEEGTGPGKVEVVYSYTFDGAAK